MDQDAYTLSLPAHRLSATIFSSPHSGRDYPAPFVAASPLDARTLRSSEDAFVDMLFACAPDFGAVALTAHVPRCIVDLNRGADEIDPMVVRGTPRHPLNQRTLAGLGVIPRVVSQGRVIHERMIERAEAEHRIETCWRPYHQALAALIAEARGFAPLLLLDEVAAHLDATRRDALFAALAALPAQSFLTGTETEVFRPLRGIADIFRAGAGKLVPEGETGSP